MLESLIVKKYFTLSSNDFPANLINPKKLNLKGGDIDGCTCRWGILIPRGIQNITIIHSISDYLLLVHWLVLKISLPS